jgi:hypothetical protein
MKCFLAIAVLLVASPAYGLGHYTRSFIIPDDKVPTTWPTTVELRVRTDDGRSVGILVPNLQQLRDGQQAVLAREDSPCGYGTCIAQWQAAVDDPAFAFINAKIGGLELYEQEFSQPGFLIDVLSVLPYFGHSHYGNQIRFSLGNHTVPEPATWVLVALAMVYVHPRRAFCRR